MSASETLILGIDTGGTFTDAVVMDGSATSVIAKAKVPTSHHDLVEGVAAVIDAVVGSQAGSNVDPSAIGLVSLSTTLATNTLVEGHGDPACLVVAGFGQTERERLQHRLQEVGASGGDAILASVAGGHDANGREVAAIAEAEIADVVAETADRVTAYAVATQFSVRNPAHELAISRVIAEVGGHPVTCSHELSARLDGPRRALTALLNARLIGIVARLENAVRAALEQAGITAPLAIVRGDGSLASAELLARRPIETILSGPAASVVGAQHLAGPTENRAIVVDIGGTTTDIAAITNNRPAITPDGAVIAGHQTMVKAIDLVTNGIGGDSEVRADTGDDDLRIGPARAIPLSRFAVHHPEVVELLTRELASPTATGQGRVLVRTGSVADTARQLDRRDRELLADLADGPRCERDIAATNRELAVVERLRRAGILRVATFTPTDAAVIHRGLDAGPTSTTAARLGAELLARRGGTGTPLAESGEGLASRVIQQLVTRSASLVVAAALRADGVTTVDAVDPGELLHAGLEHHRGFLSVDVDVAAVIVAVGASAASYYPQVADSVGARTLLPEHAEVANAVGAAVARVRVENHATITRPRAGRYEVHGVIVGSSGPRAHRSLDEAKADALAELTGEVGQLAEAAGADPDGIVITDRWQAASAVVAGRDVLVEATLTVTATGHPRLG